MSRYVDEMSRDELVTEVKEFLQWGIFAHHEVGDPTVLSAVTLRRGVKRLRLRALIEGRLGPHGRSADPARGAPESEGGRRYQ